MSLNFEVGLYIKNRIDELISKYNADKKTHENAYKAKLGILTRETYSKWERAKKINQLNTDYVSTLQKLKKSHAQSVSTINSFKVNPITIKRKRALLIGINDYIGEDNDLAGCVNDVTNVKTKLLTLGYSDTNIKTILDAEATSKNILESLTNLLTTSVSGDLLFFQYSGHGSYQTDKNLDEFNTNNDQDIACVDGKNISDDFLKRIIVKNLKPGVTLFAMFDCCYSGSALDLRYQYMDTLNNNGYVENMKELETNGNVIMISGCTDMQTSADSYINEQSQGAMTWSFLKSLNDASNDITWRQLITNMRNKIISISTTKKVQTPQISSGKIMTLDAKIFI
jgi:LysM repeat protein